MYVLGADNLTSIQTWVDASYAVHPDMKSHTGGVMSFGTGGIMCKSSKQKLNTKSSTEAEVVGASDYLPNTIWMQRFLREQGYNVSESFYEQDNESAIKLEKNGQMSAGAKSRHINIRYFWIKDRVQSEGITIRHCPTLEMLADFFTKPLQGHLFRRFRDVVLGHCPVTVLRRDPALPSEERVGENRTGACGTVPLSTGTVVPLSTSISMTGDDAQKRTWAEVVSGKGKQLPAVDKRRRFVSTTLSKQSR